MTVLRAGEILGLRLEDIDFERQTLAGDADRLVWPSPNSEDVLPLPRPLAAILRQHLQTWKENPGRLVFVNKHGRP